MNNKKCNNLPLVSVVIPTFNRPQYLQRCIESIKNQTYKNIEIIVVDDNNPNTLERRETEKVLSLYKNNSNIIYLKHERNKNGSAARNTGWKFSKGEYITFVDDDDIIYSDKIQKQVNCLAGLDRSWGACYTGYQLIKKNGSRQISKETRQGDCYIDALMRTLFMGSGSNLLLRREVVDKINGYDESFIRNQDIEFLARVLEKYKLAYVDEILLSIYQDDDRIASRSFESLDSYAAHYVECFTGRIKKLDMNDQERIMAVISLERFRIAIYKHRYVTGLSILISNHVKFKYIYRYTKYIVKRFISKESYGFNGL